MKRLKISSGKGITVSPPVKPINICCNNWISVKDRLPQHDEIIVYACDEIRMASVGTYSAVSKDVLVPQDWLPWKDVTHWMPLPPTPKEKP